MLLRADSVERMEGAPGFVQGYYSQLRRIQHIGCACSLAEEGPGGTPGLRARL